MPLLMLFAAGCQSPSASNPAVLQTALGNAYRIQLPAGTTLTLPDDASAAQVRAIAVNEIGTPDSGLPTPNCVRLTQPLQLVSPAYIADRDATDRAYALRIVQLEEQLKAATTK